MRESASRRLGIAIDVITDDLFVVAVEECLFLRFDEAMHDARSVRPLYTPIIPYSKWSILFKPGIPPMLMKCSLFTA